MDQLPSHSTSQSPSDMAGNADQRSVTSSANNLPPHIQAALARASQQVQSHEPQSSPQCPERPIVRLPGHSQHQFSPTRVPHQSPPPFSHANSPPYHPYPEQQHHQSYFGPSQFTPTVRLPPTTTQRPHAQNPQVQQPQPRSVQFQQLQSQYPQVQRHQVQHPQVRQPQLQQQQPQSRQPYHPHHIQGQSNLSSRQPSNMSAAQAPYHPQFGQHGLDGNGARRLPLLNRQLYDPGPSGGGYQSQSSHSHQQKSNEIAMKGQGKYLGYIAPKIIRDASITTDELKTKERFRQALQKTAQGVIADFATQTISITVNTKGIQLSCYGSLANGFALKNSDMDLLLVLPSDTAKKLHDVIPDMQRALEKAFLDLGLGARLLTKTRVPILRVCEKPTHELYTALKEEREKWEKEGEKPKKSKDATNLKVDEVDPKPAKPAEETETLEIQKGKDTENRFEQKAKGGRRKWSKLELSASGANQDVGGDSKSSNSHGKATAAKATKRDVVSESGKNEKHEPAARLNDIRPIPAHDSASIGHVAPTVGVPTLDTKDQPQSTSVSSAHSQPLIVDKLHGPLSTRRDVDEETGRAVNEKAPPIQPISTVASPIPKDRPTQHTETTLVQVPAGEKDSAADYVHPPIASEDISASRNDPAPPMSPTEPEDKPTHRDTSHLEFPKIGVGVQCDVNFSNYIALHNTELLRCYAGCDDRVRDIGLFVKAWAKIRKINSPYHGTLSSYGYVLMVIHYLVNIAQPPVIPNLQLVYRDPPPHQAKEELRTVDGCNVRFWRDENEIQRYRQRGMITKNDQSLGSLLRGFFTYFASQGTFRQRGFNWTQDIISLRTQGGLLPKRAKGWTEAKTTESGVKLRYLFAIEDPFELDHNIARTVVHGGIVAIRDEFRRANKILTRIEHVPGCGWQWRDDDGSVGEDLFTEAEDRLDLQKPRFKKENESKKPDDGTSTDPKVINEQKFKLPKTDPNDEQQVPVNSKQSGKGSKRSQYQKGIANDLKTKTQPEQHPKEQVKMPSRATKKDTQAQEKSKSVKAKGKEPDLWLKETQNQPKEVSGPETETRKSLQNARKAGWVEREEKRKAAELNAQSTEQGSSISIKGKGTEKGAESQDELALKTELSRKEEVKRARNKRLAERRKAKRLAERGAKRGNAKIVDDVVRAASAKVKNAPPAASASQVLKPSSANVATSRQSQRPPAKKKYYPEKGTKPKGGRKAFVSPAGTQHPTASPARSKSSTSSLNHTAHTSETSVSLPSQVLSSFISTLAPVTFEPITLPPDNVHDYPMNHLSSCHTTSSNGIEGDTVEGEGGAGSDVSKTALSPREKHTLGENPGTDEQALVGMGEMAFAFDSEEDEDTTDPDDEARGEDDTTDDEEVDVDRESMDDGSDVN